MENKEAEAIGDPMSDLFEDLDRALKRNNVVSIENAAIAETSPEQALEPELIMPEPEVTPEPPVGSDPEINQDWIIHLTGINNVSITEFNKYDYKFRRVPDPDKKLTDKFEVFTRPDGGEWKILNGLLTERYSVACLEPFTKNLESILPLTGQPELRLEPFKSAWIGNLDSPVNLWEDDAAKIVFALVTGVDIEDIRSLSTNVAVMALNSYDGKARLKLDYSLRTTGQINNTTQSFRDYFSMVQHSTNVIHGQNLIKVRHDIEGMTQNIVSTSEQLKEIRIDADNPLVDKLAKSFNSDGRKMFGATWANLVSDYRTLFHMCVVASIVIDKHWTNFGYLKARGVLEKAVKSALTD